MSDNLIKKLNKRKAPKPMPIKNNEFQGIDLKRKLIYRNFHQIDDSVYLVEIS
jgi:hypothetical protein